MTIYTKPLTDPEVLASLKEEKKTLLEVKVSQFFIVDVPYGMTVEQIVQDWFVRCRGRSHAWRDGSHVGGGGDVVSEVKVLTEDGRVVLVDYDKKQPVGPADGGRDNP